MAPSAELEVDQRVVTLGLSEAAIRRVGESRTKRLFDIAVSLTLLLAMVPILLLIALAIKLDSRGPVLYRVRRVGYLGHPLMMLKFRKMHHDAKGGPITTSDDPRLTRLGRILTRTRLDELPQLWDVLRGRMSIVGPRPEDPRFVALHSGEYQFIVSVRPGITGLTQLAFAEESHIINPHTPVEHYVQRLLPQKLMLDSLYAHRSDLRMDVSIIGWTVMAVLFRYPVAVNRVTGQMTIRRRPVQANPAFGCEVAANDTFDHVGQRPWHQPGVALKRRCWRQPARTTSSCSGDLCPEASKTVP